MSKLPQSFQDMRALGRAMRLKWSGIRSGITISDQPAFDPDFEALFREQIQNVQFYLEFGSGASTLIAARAGVETICVESDRKFAQAVSDAVGKDAPVTIIHSDIGMTEDWGYPVFTRPTAKHHQRWRNYTEKAFAQVASTGRFPDLILVDGRFRRACALASAYEAVQAGAETVIHVDDYVGRDHYAAVEDYLGTPEITGRTACFRISADTLRQDITPEILHKVHEDIR
ncbi:hypothetical protein SAMN02745824_0675 [Parasphingorhabdus marina DSM 22363]|uniref:Methyltransferase domain-containing protein n=1 Tax=Parasphingorhabdus marina DSM 22363 TaxID=1123272 RepID=A0A1N6CPW3_9SPHN|nr:hypothetical protein [Parasphingorhabdus marina]SIN60485.1 hypothetical protein SAMN02745824_0675 [Parasphingorhabdus marina DSM 22363]